MSDVDGMSGLGPHRIGDSERDAATAALDVHRQAGRLDAVEFEDRQVQVSRARTWAEVQPLFIDLPEPHPSGMPSVPVSTPRPLVPTTQTSQALQPHAQGSGLLGGLVPEQYRSTVMALTPFAATALFFLTRTWIWFLAIPVMGILLFGPDGDDSRKREERAARRDLRREGRKGQER